MLFYEVLLMFCPNLQHLALLGCLEYHFLLFGFTYLFIAIIGIILSLVGQIGDFAASSIKRFADSKDYGNMLPGHGGMLDRIDSLIFIAPFVFLIVSLI